MINGRPETYREIVVLSKANKMAEYVQVAGENMVQQICDFLLQNSTNKVLATPSNLMFMNGVEETQFMLHVTSTGKEFETIEMTADRWNIRVPYSSSSHDGWGSSNNNNNNNNNNNS